MKAISFKLIKIKKNVKSNQLLKYRLMKINYLSILKIYYTENIIDVKIDRPTHIAS